MNSIKVSNIKFAIKYEDRDEYETNENTIKSLIDKVKNKSNYSGFIIHDSYFFERMEVNKEINIRECK